MRVFRVTYKGQEIYISFEDSPFDFYFAKDRPEDEGAELNLIIRDLVDEFVVSRNLVAEAKLKVIHVLLYDKYDIESPGSTNRLMECVALNKEGSFLPLASYASSISLSSLRANCSLLFADLTVHEEASGKFPDQFFAKAIRQRYSHDYLNKIWYSQVNATKNAEIGKLNAFKLPAIEFYSFAGVKIDDHYNAELQAFCAKRVELASDALTFKSFDECKARYDLITKKTQAVDKLVSDLKGIITEVDSREGFKKDLETIKIKEALTLESNPFAYATGEELLLDFTRRVEESVKRYDLQLKNPDVKPPTSDLSDIFVDAQLLIQAKKYTKEILFTVLYNAAVNAFNEILESKPELREDQVVIFERIFTMLNIYIDMKDLSITPYADAKKSFILLPLTDVAVLVKTMLFFIHQQEQKQPGWTSSVMSYVPYASSSKEPAFLKSVSLQSMVKEINATATAIDANIRTYFRSNDSLALYSHLYGATLPVMHLPFKVSPPKLGSWVAWTNAADAQFEWFIQEGDELEHGFITMRDILKKYGEKEQENQTLAQIEFYVEQLTEEAEEDYIPYWSARLKCYQELQTLQREAERIQRNVQRDLTAYAREFDGKYSEDLKSYIDVILDVTQFQARDNQLAAEEVKNLGEYLDKLKVLEAAVKDEADLHENKRRRVIEYGKKATGIGDDASALIIRVIDKESEISSLEKRLKKSVIEQDEKNQIISAIDKLKPALASLKIKLSQIEADALLKQQEDEPNTRAEFEKLRASLSEQDGGFKDAESQLAAIDLMFTRSINTYQTSMDILKGYLEQNYDETELVNSTSIVGQHYHLLLEYFADQSSTEAAAIQCLNSLSIKAKEYDSSDFALTAYRDVFRQRSKQSSGDVLAASIEESKEHFYERIVRQLKLTVKLDEKELMQQLSAIINNAFWDDKGSSKFLGMGKPGTPSYIEKMRDELKKPNCTYNEIKTIAMTACRESKNTNMFVDGFYKVVASGVLPTFYWIDKYANDLGPKHQNAASSSYKPS